MGGDQEKKTQLKGVKGGFKKYRKRNESKSKKHKEYTSELEI